MQRHSEPSRHHYIPVFYLKYWTQSDGRLERYTRPVAGKVVVRRVYPSETGFERNLYDSPGENERSRQWLETRLFQQIDNAAARVLAKLNSDSVPTLSVEEMSHWSIFVRSLHHRTPDRMRAFRQSGHAEWLRIIEDAQAEYPRLRGEGDPPTFEEYRALHTPAQVDRLVLRVLPTILFSERVGVFMNDMHKRYFDLPHGLPKLLISDSPLAMTNGLQTDGGHYALPLSPRRLLIAAHERSTIQRASEAKLKELVVNMNRWAVEQARYFVAATDRTQDRFVRNRFSLGRHG
jgi:hypothetical protein